MPSEAGVWSTYVMTHDDGTTDGRYTLATEWTGHHFPQWVGRFCGEWIHASHDEFAVWLRMVDHNRDRRESMERI